MKIIDYYFRDSGFWIRIFGHGIVVVDRTKVKEPFSIRKGIRKQIKIGEWGITIAKTRRSPMERREQPVPVVQIVLTIIAIMVILAVLEHYGVLHLSNLFTNKYK